MAELIFEIGRYAAFLGVFFLLMFGLALWRFRAALAAGNLSIDEHDGEDEGEVTRPAVDLGGTVHYLRAHGYEGKGAALAAVGERYRRAVVYPFYLGVWSFCSGLALMSATLGFVLFN